MKYLFLFTFVALILSGCAGMTPKDQVVAETVYIETLGAVLDNNPEYKPIVLGIANAAKDALNGNSVITHDKAVSWLLDQIASKFGDNARIKRVSYVLISAYMPDWGGSTLQFVTADQKAQLLHVIDLTVVAAS